MILDTSAIVAITLKEPGFETLLDKLRERASFGVGIPTLTETAIVLSARLSAGCTRPTGSFPYGGIHRDHSVRRGALWYRRGSVAPIR